MAALTAGLIGAGIGAAAGALSGSDIPDEEKRRVADQQKRADEAYRNFAELTGSGPGSHDVRRATEYGRSYADMLGQYSQSGGMPSQGDITQSNSLAGMLYQAQQEQLRQAFVDQGTSANRQAAMLGRSLDDPILRAKLAQEQTRQQGTLNANQGSFATQLAMSLPGQRLGYAAQRGDILNQLSQQALSNRQAVLGAGQGMLQNSQSWAQAQREPNKVGQALSGAIGGAGAGLSAFSNFSQGNAYSQYSNAMQQPGGFQGASFGGQMAAIPPRPPMFGQGGGYQFGQFSGLGR